MIERVRGNLAVRVDTVPGAARELEERGAVALRQVFSQDEIAALRRDVERVYDASSPDARLSTQSEDGAAAFRYEMLNRSAPCQRAIAHPGILEVIEPLLGEDCHVIANTAWRNPAGLPGSHRGQAWHIDAGPHVPRPEGTPWPDEIPYPIFAIGAHLLIDDLHLADGPTGFIPSSHRSGRFPPRDRIMDEELDCDGIPCEAVLGRAGDVVLFVSDVWHRRLPTREGDRGRFFLQAHYGRRDIAQRLRPTAVSNHLSEAAEARAKTARERSLVGLHPPFFYDG